MPPGTEVGLSPCNTVLDDGDPAPPWKAVQQPPPFGPCLLWSNGRPSQQLLSTQLLYITFIDIGYVALIHMHAADIINCDLHQNSA